MRLRGLILGTALVSLTLITAKAGPFVLNDEAETDVMNDGNATEPIMNMTVVPAPAPLVSEDEMIGSAYYDTLNILSTSNSCSAFFGGPGASIDIFNQFIRRVEKHYFSSSIGMQMSGKTMNILNASTKRSYRIFDKVSINVNGPFYRKKYWNSSRSLPWIGEFEPNTKEIRVLIFLHELGHIVKGTDGKWLLPNDGGNDNQSALNSATIEGVCKHQIKNLGKVDPK